jgi:hypothetical protein
MLIRVRRLEIVEKKREKLPLILNKLSWTRMKIRGRNPKERKRTRFTPDARKMNRKMPAEPLRVERNNGEMERTTGRKIQIFYLWKKW